VNAKVIVPTSPDLADHTPLDHLDTFKSFSSCSLPYPCPECCNMSLVEYHDMLEGTKVECVESLGTFRGYDPSLDTYSLYLAKCLQKLFTPLHLITLTIFIRHLIKLVEHSLLFHDSCLSALLAFIYVTCSGV